MDKKSISKQNKGISPMTPCRPVGLRRKLSGVKNTKSPSLDFVKESDITRPVSTNAGVIKARALAGQIPSAKNDQDLSTESNATKELKNLQNNDCKGDSIKRKSTIPHGRSIVRKIVCSDFASSASANTDSSNKDTLCIQEENSFLVKNTIPVSAVLKDSDSAKEDGTDRCQLHSHTQLSITQEQSLEKKYITTAEINTLKEQVAAKEKKLKELELAALYKRKHDHKQVANEIECWLQGCKEALCDLQSELAKRNQSYSLCELLKKLGIPPSLLGIDEDSE